MDDERPRRSKKGLRRGPTVSQPSGRWTRLPKLPVRWLLTCYLRRFFGIGLRLSVVRNNSLYHNFNMLI